jgi:hypothetical protein
MQRLLVIMAALVISSAALAQTNEPARKGMKCRDNAGNVVPCKVSRDAGMRDRKRNDPNYEPTVERDGYEIHRRDDSAPAGGGGY